MTLSINSYSCQIHFYFTIKLCFVNASKTYFFSAPVAFNYFMVMRQVLLLNLCNNSDQA